MDDRDRYAEGMKVRRAVLGDAHVDRSLKNSNEFNEEFQDLITRYAWGEVWTREGLPRHTRSGLTDAVARLKGIEGVSVVQLSKSDIVRHRLVQEIVRAYDESPRHAGPNKPRA